MANWVYAVAVAQVLLGCIVAVFNLILLLAIATRGNVKTASNCLLGNMWFANLLLGIIVAISNVVDPAGIYVFQKTEGTISIVNGLVTISMLLALTTNRVVTVRTRKGPMSVRTSFIIIIVTWATVFVLTLIKAVVYGLDKIGTTEACFRCFLGFEVSALVIFAVATLITYLTSAYLICNHRNRTITDSSRPTINIQKEYKMTLTIGLMLISFILTFLAFVFLIPAWLTNGSKVDPDAAEIIITLFYTHSLINPTIALIRDEELRKGARSILRCQRPPDHPPAPAAQQGTPQMESAMRNEPVVDNDRPMSVIHRQQRAVVHLPPIENPIRTRTPSVLETRTQNGYEGDVGLGREEAAMNGPTAPPMEQNGPHQHEPQA